MRSRSSGGWGIRFTAGDSENRGFLAGSKTPPTRPASRLIFSREDAGFEGAQFLAVSSRATVDGGSRQKHRLGGGQSDGALARAEGRSSEFRKSAQVGRTSVGNCAQEFRAETGKLAPQTM